MLDGTDYWPMAEIGKPNKVFVYNFEFNCVIITKQTVHLPYLYLGYDLNYIAVILRNC